MVLAFRPRSIQRLLIVFGLLLFVRLWFPRFSYQSTPSLYNRNPHEILEHNVLERVTRPEKAFNVQKHKFLQVRMGRDERDDLLGDVVRDGVWDFWERFQKPQYVL